MRKVFKIFLLNAVMLSLVLAMSSCKKTTTKKKADYDGNPVVTMYLSNDMEITLELYPDVAPITVENFLSLVEDNFYNGTIFHRIIENFMVQGGGYYIKNKTVTAKEADTIKGEFSANGVTNNISHVKGVLSMARASAYDSASSQFFICSADSTYLDGNYAAFGKCVDDESVNNVVLLSKVETTTLGSFSDFPKETIYITRIDRIN